jgi:hypothetical protein
MAIVNGILLAFSTIFPLLSVNTTVNLEYVKKTHEILTYLKFLSLYKGRDKSDFSTKWYWKSGCGPYKKFSRVSTVPVSEEFAANCCVKPGLVAIGISDGLFLCLMLDLIKLKESKIFKCTLNRSFH